MTKRIPLSQQGHKHKGEFYAIVDDEDFDALNAYRWSAIPAKPRGKWYAIRSVKDGEKRKYFLMHVQIMNPPKGLEVDHKDGDGLRNTRDNLRICSHQQNTQNMKMHKNNTSGYKGVCWNSLFHKWQVGICINGKNVALGYFPDPISAARAYDAAALQHFGEFALTNFPKEAL